MCLSANLVPRRLCSKLDDLILNESVIFVGAKFFFFENASNFTITDTYICDSLHLDFVSNLR